MPTENNKLSIELDGIGHAISDNKLTVPANQRSYAWEEKHVNELFNDLLSSIRKSEDEYFIGSIVISFSNHQNEVVDGQQRLATISILIAAIRDYFLEKNDTERAEDIQRNYLSSRDRRSLELIPRLKLNIYDHDFYHKKIILTSSSVSTTIAPTRSSHERIKKAYGLAKESIRAYTSMSNNPSEALLDLLDFIDKHLKIILVRVPDHANAFNIFETLNDRGLDLAISDLLKNYIYGQSENRISEAQASWTEMYSLLENNQREDLIVTFIRHYWSSIHGLTRERELYNEIKKKVNSKQRAIDMAKDLADRSKIYIALIDLTQAFWSEYAEESKNNMELLNMFGMIQVRPLLLAIFASFNKKDIEKALKYLVSASVRFLIHGGLGGGALETQYSERAKEITNGEIRTFSELCEKLARAVPSDSQFEESFSNATISKSYLSRYYLVVLENYTKGKDKLDFVPNSDTNAVNLEHVLPQNPDKSWGSDEETHRVMYNRLGNLALMNSRINSTIGNNNFASKKEFYLDSSFALTKQIATYESWGIDEINKRQKELAKFAVKAWPIK